MSPIVLKRLCVLTLLGVQATFAEPVKTRAGVSE